MPVDPTGRDLKRYLAEDPGGPVVMLNLLQLAPGGRDSYEQYTHDILPFLEKVGGEVVYVGDLSTEVVERPADEPDWDILLLVRYPSRQAFTSMVADPDYQAITHLRTQALSEAVLQASTPWTASAG